MINTKYLETLELDTVLRRLSEYCVCDKAKELALSLKPQIGTAEVRRSLAETSAALSMLIYNGSPSFFRVQDISFCLHRAVMSGVLNTVELLNIAKVLQAARVLKNYRTNDKVPDSCLDPFFHALRGNRFLEQRITDSILGEDEIADTASQELASIRKKIRLESQSIRSSLQKIISSPSYSKALQEQLITTRNGRFVVPVKIEYKNDIPGLIHDVSSSGMTVFIEPSSVVRANNELRELFAGEKKEIERILAELSADCASHEEDILSDFHQIIQLDFIFSKAKLSAVMKGVEAETSLKGIILRHARHPLLDPAKTVPTDILLGENFDTLVITGPNTGGKTVALKTIGLLALMNQCGLHVPADSGTSLPVFSHIMADIGDEQSIEQNLSTFSSHMKNIVEILDECDDNSLLLFDELGAGTDPTEGAALAISIIEAGRKKGALIAATTHYSELKIYAINHERIQNASCEFDVNTLSPTYRIIMGIPGKSNAFAIARKLGISEEIIQDASERLLSSDVSLEETINKLDEIRVRLEEDKRSEAKKLQSIVENEKKSARLRAELEVRLEKSEIKAKREAERILQEARNAAEEVFAELDKMKRTVNELDDVNRINEERNKLRARLKSAGENIRPVTVSEAEESLVSSRRVKAGDVVLIRSINSKAEVLSVSKDGELTLKAGIMTVTAKEEDVYLLENEKKKESRPVSSGTELRSAGMSSSIDLRGLEAAEAVYTAEQYLDNAVMAKLNTVTIIHGKGTGVLRAAIHTMLKKNKLVKSFRLGLFGEGETGVTIVELK